MGAINFGGVFGGEGGEDPGKGGWGRGGLKRVQLKHPRGKDKWGGGGWGVNV